MYLFFIMKGRGDVQEKWDNFAHEKPHTMYDQVLEKVGKASEKLRQVSWVLGVRVRLIRIVEL